MTQAAKRVLAGASALAGAATPGEGDGKGEVEHRSVAQVAISLSTARTELAALQAGPGEGADEAAITEHRGKVDAAIAKIGDLEVEYRSSLALAEADKRLREEHDQEAEERAALVTGASLGAYFLAGCRGEALSGREAELNKAMKLPDDGTVHLPLEVLAGQDMHQHGARELRGANRAEVERRAAIDASGADLGQTGQVRRWLDRLFAMTAAGRLGITFESPGVGEPVYVSTLTGTTAEQVARGEAIEDSSFTFSSASMTPKRYGLSYTVRYEDLAMVPGFEDAVRRDVAGVMGLRQDNAIFNGDTGATGTDADITGLNTAAGLVAKTMAVADVDDGGKWVALLAEFIDGIRCETVASQNIVYSIPVARGLDSTLVSASADIPTLWGAWLRMQGISWGTKVGLADDTISAGDMLAIGSLPRGLPGAAVAAIWPSIQLVRDIYTRAKNGEVVVTMQGLWDFKIIRPNQFFRVAAS